MAKNIYVGNLPYNATGDDLVELFQPYGTVTSGQVIFDKFSGRSRGFDLGLTAFPYSVTADMCAGRDRSCQRRIATAPIDTISTRRICNIPPLTNFIRPGSLSY